MYMPAQFRPRILAETLRVLAPGRCLRIWDAEIPAVAASGGAGNNVFMIELEVIIGAGEHARPHRTTYGVGLRDKA